MSGEEQDEAQKTEEPTAKKLDETRKKGQVPLSREVNNWVMLFTATLVIGGFGPSMFSKVLDTLRTYIELSHDFPSAPGGLGIAMGGVYYKVLSAMSIALILMVLAAVLSPLVQIGPLFAPKSIKPDLSKISPIKGMKRLFSMRSLVEFFKGILKIVIISIVGVIILYPFYDKLEYVIGMPIIQVASELRGLFIRLMIGVLVALMIIAVADLFYQRYEHTKKLRMTKQEVKDEYKQTEGDPHIKAKLRQLRVERSRQRMMQAVPQADVVITNPTHFSIALKYDAENMDAPQCIAKGIDEVAMRIREVAKEHDIPLYENKPLARTLYDVVEIDEFIPANMYKAVAEVISFVFQNRKGKNSGKKS